MEMKDWAYVASLVVTLGISLASLVVAIKNRKNALREHLYKEQLALFLKLRFQFAELKYFFDTIEDKRQITKEEDEKVDVLLKNIEMTFDGSDIVVEEYIYDLVDDAVIAAYDYGILLAKTNGNPTEKDKADFKKVLNSMEDSFRDLLGVDRLTGENRSVIGSRRDQKR